MTEAEKAALYTGVADAFQSAMADSLGWFYWSYKVLCGGRDGLCDDAARMRLKGWLRF